MAGIEISGIERPPNLSVTLSRAYKWNSEDAGHATADLNGPSPKIFSRSFAKIFSETPYVTRKPVTSPTEGGSGGASPPAFTRTTGTSKSPSEAVFIMMSCGNPGKVEIYVLDTAPRSKSNSIFLWVYRHLPNSLQT